MRSTLLTVLFSSVTLLGSGLQLAHAETAAKPKSAPRFKGEKLPKLVGTERGQFGDTKTYEMPSGRKVQTRTEGGGRITVENGNTRITNQPATKQYGNFGRVTTRRIEDLDNGDTLTRESKIPAPRGEFMRSESLRTGGGLVRYDVEQKTYADERGRAQTILVHKDGDQHELPPTVDEAAIGKAAIAHAKRQAELDKAFRATKK